MNLLKKIEITAGENEANLRLDVFLHQKIPQYSRSYWQKLIKQNHVLVDNQAPKVSDRIIPGQIIDCFIPKPEIVEMRPEKIPLQVVYEDTDLIVINKPAGLVVHPGAGVRSGTLVNGLLYHCKDLSGIAGRLRPGVVHRLDKNTSGLLVAAKNDQAHHSLAHQLMKREMVRKYHALVWHILSNDDGIIETFLSRSKRNRKLFVASDSGKKAITHYRVIKRFQFLTLIELRLETGRTHQIRSHLSHIHHPVFGDPEYNGRLRQIGQLSGQENRNFSKRLLSMLGRQALHARYLAFQHPRHGRLMEFSSDYPKDIASVIEALEKNNV
ncbi:MAG: RluA family pseudouridine synthase [bacterium]|nr:MAG: RluA family pseudouridine synthase [bacterium]